MRGLILTYGEVRWRPGRRKVARTTKAFFRLTLCTVLSLFSVDSARAAFDAYLFLPGIPGEATETNHLNWIKMLSFAESQTNTLAGAGAQFTDLAILKPVDKASPLLLTACATGRVIASGRLQLVNTDPRRFVFYDILLSSVVVTGLSPSQPVGAKGPPTERLSLGFRSITWTYTAFAGSGLPSEIQQAYWNVVQTNGASSSIAAFQITGIQKTAGQVTLSWDGQAGKTYTISASPVVQGPYSAVAQQTATTNGTVSVTISSPGPIQFYWLQGAL